MLTFRTSEEFAAWYAVLDQATAEDVAATLEVIVQLGPEREAPGSTEWLTWYEHPSISERLRDLGPYQHPHAPACGTTVARFVRERGRLQRLRTAGREASPVAGGHRTLEAAGRSEGPRGGRCRHPHPEGSHPARPRCLGQLPQAAAVRRAARHAARGGRALRVLRCPGDPRGVLRRPRGRRVRGDRGARTGTRAPGDRSFYGDSVRFAEHRWREFLDAGAEERPSP
jgi:hypothetical protein